MFIEWYFQTRVLVCALILDMILILLPAFLMVVLNRKIAFGKNDWVLLVCSLGIPAIPGAIFAALEWWGPAGFW